jgi:hypothetical protein
MQNSLRAVAQQESTLAVQFSFRKNGPGGALVAPETLSWSLYDKNRNVINSRSNVSVSTPTSQQVIVLSGDDLQRTTSEAREWRSLVVTGTYDSTLGSGLPFSASYVFWVESGIPLNISATKDTGPEPA